MIEEWKDVVGYEDFYIISNFGVIKRYRRSKKNKSERIIFQTTTQSGYKRTVLQKSGVIKNHFVHRLVAEAFHGKRPEGLQVNHINKIRDDNTSTNLEYVTPLENIRHSRNGKIRGIRFRHNFYEAYIWIDKRNHFLIKTLDKETAHSTYRDTYKQWYGFYPW